MFLQQELPLSDANTVLAACRTAELQCLSHNLAIQRPCALSPLRSIRKQDQNMEIAIADVPNNGRAKARALHRRLGLLDGLC